MIVQKVSLSPFHSKPRPSGVSLESAELENILEPKLVKITMRYGGVGYFMSLKERWGYISAQKLESGCSKSFAVSISLQTKAIKI